MAETPTSLDGVTSLYRRFRPGRFVEMRGQEHVVRALQGAVEKDRIVHAYLFSGPRGTGKTTTARILAKALNCENPVAGDACNVCASCLAITRGTSLDVVELDAASNNSVDDIREIIAGAWTGTPGRWKVYIVDEVHMLTKAAEAAFLKTLEEPPPHVVFVLATTDPHKVVATIRSRTQHLEFRLLDAATLSSLLHDVRDAAGLGVDEASLDAAVRLGRGSARDALSALDQVAATGSVAAARPVFDAVLLSLGAGDSVGVLSALHQLHHDGWDAEQLGESLAGELRQCFLLLVAPDVADAMGEDRERLSTWGQGAGLAKTVRCLETIGRTLREMKSSPVPMMLLEVALVRLTKPELDREVAALEERLTKLERSVANGVTVPAPVVAPPARPIGAVQRTVSAPVVTPAAEVTPAPTAAPVATAPVAAGPVGFDEFQQRFAAKVVPRLSRSAQIFLASAALRSLDGQVVTFAVPSESLRSNAERIQSGLRGALEHEFQMNYQFQWLVDAAMDTGPAPAPAAPFATPPRPTATVEEEPMETFTPNDESASSLSMLLMNEVFPGAEEL